MATLRDPFVSEDKDIQAKLIAMGAKPASTDSALQTAAVSKVTPGVLVGGARNPDGTQIQSFTGRYNADGSVNTGAQPRAVAAPAPGAGTTTPSVATPGTPGAPSVSVPDVPMTAEQYQASRGVNVDEAAIREDVRKRNQARIDAVNLAYEDILRSQARTNEANLGSTRAINARGGLLGSDFGEANTMQQRERGDAATRQIQMQRDAAVNSIISNIDNLASGEIQAKKQEAIGNADAYKNYLAEAQSKANDYIKNLGASGVSFDEFKAKNPDALNSLLKNSGKDEFTVALSMNAAKPSAARIEWKTDVKGDHVIAYGVNPQTGEVEYHTKQLPAEAKGNDVKIVEGELWSISPDGKTASKLGEATKEVKPLTKTVKGVSYFSEDGGRTWKKSGGAVPPVAPSSPKKTNDLPVSKQVTEALKKVQKGIAGATKVLPDGSQVPWLGADGKLSPEDYLKLRNAWIDDELSATVFDTKMKGYRNPNEVYAVGK